MKVRLVSLWSCVHVCVPWIRAGEDVQTRYKPVLQTPKPRSNTPYRLGRFTGLDRPVCDPSLGPGTGLAQRDRSQSLPACEEVSATSAPPQGGHSQLRSHTHTCDVYHSTSLPCPVAACGVAPLIDRERRVFRMDSSCELLRCL
jgi:hypothetical protein